MKNPNNLVWLDMEMTGLDSSKDLILEVAVIVTNSELEILAQTPGYAINQPDEVLVKMDEWNTRTHNESGLVKRVKESTYTVEVVEEEILKLLNEFIYKKQSPLCGNSIHQDRKFMSRFMPRLDEFLHYRNIDVSGIKELAKRWYPEETKGFVKHNKHQALEDILEAIEELKFYREKIFKVTSSIS